MTIETSDARRIADLESRVAALGATIKSLVTLLLMRGLVTRPEIAPLLEEAEALMKGAGTSAGPAEIRSIGTELPDYMRKAMGPPPDDGDHDH